MKGTVKCMSKLMASQQQHAFGLKEFGNHIKNSRIQNPIVPEWNLMKFY